ncbi:hypothetical protein G9A89_023769 [Geosiphon pyriformis]|nr:hypothetical protein G9A89_023769 [Geosiphon pyriformis]
MVCLRNISRTYISYQYKIINFEISDSRFKPKFPPQFFYNRQAKADVDYMIQQHSKFQKRSDSQNNGVKAIVKNPSLLKKLRLYAWYAGQSYCLNDNNGYLSPGIYVEKKTLTEEKEIILIIRGVIYTPEKWLKRTKNVLTSYPKIPDGQVDAFFWQQFKGARSKIFQMLKEAVTTVNIIKITFIGHGVGGVHAIFAMLDFYSFLKDIKLRAVTFGQPRIGDRVFAHRINTLVSNKEISILRVTRFDDRVPRLPERMLNGKSRYQHSLLEYWISDEDDCECEKIHLWKCHGPLENNLDGSSYTTESLECNGKFPNPTFVRHNGTYFETFMGHCDRIKPDWMENLES